MASWSHASASQINTYRDCPRKWWLQKIAKMDTPSSKAAELGKRIHSVLEDYLTTGVMPDRDTEEGKIALRGLEFLPLPGKSRVEVAVQDELPIEDAPVDILGYIDCLYLPPDGSEEIPLILDHKTTSSRKYTKNQGEMEIDVQLNVYARAIFANTDHDEVRLRLVYYGTRKPFAFPVEVTITREANDEQWRKILDSLNEMQQDSDKEEQEVKQNWSSCSKYGGCPFQAHCLLRRGVKREETPMGGDLASKLGLATKTTTGKPATGKPRTLLIGCAPLKGEDVKHFADIYAPLYKQVEEKLRVPHVSAAEYGKGWSEFAALVKKSGWPPEADVLYIDPLDKAWEYVGSILQEQADVVIRRL